MDKDLSGVPEIIMLSEVITDIPLRYGDQIVGTCDMLKDGSIHAHFNWSEIPTQIAELMRAGLVSDMSFGPTFKPGNPKIHSREPAPYSWDTPDLPIRLKEGFRRGPGGEKLTDFKIEVPERKEKNMADYSIPPRGEGPQEHRISRAIELVYQYVKDRLEKTDKHVTFGIDEVYPVWFCFILGNWKAMISTTLPDGMYYEVTYDKNNKQTYIDAYKKFDNVCVPDEVEPPQKSIIPEIPAGNDRFA